MLLDYGAFFNKVIRLIKYVLARATMFGTVVSKTIFINKNINDCSLWKRLKFTVIIRKVFGRVLHGRVVDKK